MQPRRQDHKSWRRYPPHVLIAAAWNSVEGGLEII
jgi:hypothetical protein